MLFIRAFFREGTYPHAVRGLVNQDFFLTLQRKKLVKQLTPQKEVLK